MSQDEPENLAKEGPSEEGLAQKTECRSGPDVQFCARCGQVLPPSGGMVVCLACGLWQCPTCGA